MGFYRESLEALVLSLGYLRLKGKVREGRVRKRTLELRRPDFGFQVRTITSCVILTNSLISL